MSAFVDLWSMLGYTNNAKIFQEAFAGCSNVILTDNPEFTLDDFTSVFPVFKITDEVIEDEINIPTAFFNLVLAMANKCIKYDRYPGIWKYLMCLFIAHHCVLYLQTQKGDANSQAALQGSMPSGIATSKSVDGLSISYDLQGVAEDLAGYGTWKYTIYGQQLATLTKPYGGAGMWVNG